MLIFALSLSAVSAADNNTVITDKVDVGTFTDLQIAINNATNTLNLEKDYKNTEKNIGFTIDKNLEINGNGHTIDANGESGIFQISPDKTLTINNVTFKNSIETKDKFNPSNGAIYCQGNLNVNNCHFINNEAIFGRGDI